ncbi:MAG: hypothetical protein NTW55_00495 [Planctomycetota bacterium]|nr:hypothetical protein [Planctomycetota bacterium]
MANKKKSILIGVILLFWAVAGIKGNEIATIFGKKISSGDIEPNSQMAEKYKKEMSEENFNKWLKQNRERNLEGLIFGPLFEKFISDSNIPVSDKEIEEINSRMDQSLEKMRIKQIEYRNNLVKDINDPNLDENKRKEMESRIAMLNKNIDEPKHEIPKKVSTKGATRIIKIWKANKKLYEKYGGRVVFQQAGPEPLDAYRDFLKEQEKAGAFEIKDPNYSAMFWNYFTNDKMHTFYKDPNEARELMEKPWWLKESEDEGIKNKEQK